LAETTFLVILDNYLVLRRCWSWYWYSVLCWQGDKHFNCCCPFTLTHIELYIYNYNKLFDSGYCCD